MRSYIPFLMTILFITFCSFIDRCSDVRNLDALRKEMNEQQEAFQDDDKYIRQSIDPETRMIMDKIRCPKAEILSVYDPIKWEDD